MAKRKPTRSQQFTIKAQHKVELSVPRTSFWTTAPTVGFTKLCTAQTFTGPGVLLKDLTQDH